jgi:large subunit ribosomal protein L21
MYAVIETGGKQYRVTEGEVIDIERLDADVDDAVTFDRVLAVNNENNELSVGQPLVENALVNGMVIANSRTKKVIVYKMKRRKGYKRKHGHRQLLTRVKITEIKA